MAYHESDLQASKHPCYSSESQHKYARMHLPVAPTCNIQCNYCNRLFDCVNESRPGVTSEILAPEQAVVKIGTVKEKLPNLAVIGIAGPGDALANWASTKKTLTMVKEKYPELILCLSTNGLMLPRYAPELVELGVRHVTVTVNAIDPSIGEKIYSHIDWNGSRLHGSVAVRKLLENQLYGIRFLAQQGVLIKVNVVMIPGVNEHHIPNVVQTVRDAGASLANIMPLIPAAGSAFSHLPQTSNKEITGMRDRCQKILPQMRHCQQCRADAIGLLSHDQSAEFRASNTCSNGKCSSLPFDKKAKNEVTDALYRIAVTSKHERIVDLHFGHAEQFLIYSTDGRNSKLIERRKAIKYCRGSDYCDSGEEQKQETVNRLADCDAIVTMRIGSHAKARLLTHGILAVESCAEIPEGLEKAVQNLKLGRAG